MNLSEVKNIFNYHTLKAVINEDDGWYTKKEFIRILKRERLRSDRTGLPISYIVFDLSKHSERRLNGKFQQVLRELILLISENTREYDIKHFPSTSRIGILLIDTSIKNAKAFIERISNQLSNYFQKLKIGEISEIIESITISSYPLNAMPDYYNIEAKPVLVKNIELVKQKTQKQSHGKGMMIQENVNLLFNWDIKPTPNGAIALSAPSFWDLSEQYWKYISYKYIKRGIDFFVSLMCFIFLFPVFLIFGIIIKLTSKGPVFFRQKRVGHLGKPFEFIKYRSMYIDCDTNVHKEYVKKLIKGQTDDINKGSEEDPLYKLTDDPRITPIGQFLRKSSLDEIPQLFNVLKGDMSLVGPRPPIPYEVKEYKNWHCRRISEVKPGITGLWQVSGRNKTTFDEMVRLDIQYAENWSLWLDIKIIFKTVKAMCSFEGT